MSDGLSSFAVAGVLVGCGHRKSTPMSSRDTCSTVISLSNQKRGLQSTHIHGMHGNESDHGTHSNRNLA